MAVTPIPALVSIISVGGTAAFVVPANPNGGIITNPLVASDQGIVTAEPLYICPAGSAGLVANGPTFRLEPGQSWNIIPGQTTQTSVNAATSGHKFSAVYW